MFTKRQVVDFCEAVFNEFPETFEDDIPAQRVYFTDYTDGLCKDGMITEHQYNTWTNPF